jgi:hypothetical protein
MSDRKFTVIITLFGVIGISLALALLSMVLLDESVHSDGCTATRGGGMPAQSLSLPGN